MQTFNSFEINFENTRYACGLPSQRVRSQYTKLRGSASVHCVCSDLTFVYPRKTLEQSLTTTRNFYCVYIILHTLGRMLKEILLVTSGSDQPTCLSGPADNNIANMAITSVSRLELSFSISPNITFPVNFTHKSHTKWKCRPSMIVVLLRLLYVAHASKKKKKKKSQQQQQLKMLI